MLRAYTRWAMLLTVSSIAGLSGPPVRERAPGEEPPVLVQRIPTSLDAHALALADARTLPAKVRPFVRYVFHQEEPLLGVKTTSLTFAIDSRQPWIRRPDTIAGGVLSRIDLRWYCGPKDGDLAEWLGFYEEMAFDPSFSTFLTPDMLAFLEEDLTDLGDRVGVAELQALKDAKVDVVRFNGVHLDPAVTEELQTLLSTQAPVVEAHYLKHRMLKTIKGKAVYQVIFGGRYYEFAGIKKAVDVLGKDTKATDQDLFFQDLGIGNIKGGETADQLFDRLGSDHAPVMTISHVTGGPRKIRVFQTPAAQSINSTGAITDDIEEADIDIGDRSFANLKNARSKAREALFPKANGFVKAALFNGQGARQDQVPDTVATDFTLPRPHKQFLEPIKGCFVCHAIFGDNGWRPIRSDARDMLRPVRGESRLDVYDDRGGGRVRIVPDVLQRIAGQQFGRYAKLLDRARRDTAEVVLEATGPWSGGDGSQTDAVKLTAQHLQKEMDGWWYGKDPYRGVDARQALLEEGWLVSEDRAVAVFRALHPPDVSRAYVNDFGQKIIPEHATIAALKAGLGVRRSDWSLIQSHAMRRSQNAPYRETLVKESRGKR